MASSVQHENHFVGQSDSSVVHLTGGEVRIYSDDISVARWLQRTIETLLHAPFADEAVPVLPAVFTREGDPRSTTVETIESDEDIVRMTWHDCLNPFILNVPPGTAGRPLGVLSTFIPAAAAQRALNDRVLRMALEDRKRRNSAVMLLGQIEVWRLEYGRPTDEPRHPDLATGQSWPPKEL